MNKQSQNQQILNHLQTGGTLTPLEALGKYDCFRLGARVNDLRNDGHPIITNMVKHGGKRYASYWYDFEQVIE